MGLRKGAAEEESTVITRSNMGNVVHAATLGGILATYLQDYGKGVAYVDSEGLVRFVDPKYVTIRLPSPEEITQTMVSQGASDEEILEALALRRRMPEED